MPDIYLDNNATTRVDPAVLDVMLPFFSRYYGNPSSLHRFGELAQQALQQARRQIQELLGAAHDSEIIFTSGGTEADVTALLSALRVQPERREIITSVVEHPAVLNTCKTLAQEGYRVHFLAVDERGRIDLDSYCRLLSKRVALVSVMWANNETGTLFPVELMADMAHSAGVLFHTDAVQAVGKVPIALSSSRIDMLSLSGHKLHGPKGTGALYLRRGVPFRPLLQGGHQERERRAGTENVPALVGLGKAAELALQYMDYEATLVSALRDRLQAGMLAAVPGTIVTSDLKNRLPNTLNLIFPTIDGDDLLLLLNKQGIAVSTGSACSSGSREPSHVLQAMGFPAAIARGAVRFSLSRCNTLDEVEQVIHVLPPLVDYLCRLPPAWEKAATMA